MRKIRNLFIIFILIFLFSSITSYASTGKVNVSATRLRKEASTDSDIITNIYEGESVEIISEENDWYKVTYSGNTGYVKKSYLTVSENKNVSNTVNETNNSTSNATNSENVVDNSIANTVENNVASNIQDTTNAIVVGYNLRNMPNITSNVIATLDDISNITVVNQIGKWTKISNGTVTGWILQAKLDGSATANTVEENIASTTNEIVNNTVADTNTNTNVVNNTVENNVTNNTPTNTTSDNSIASSSLVGKKAKVNVETAKVRVEPNTTCETIDFLDLDDVVTITEVTSSEWYKVSYDSKTGYVNSKLLTVTDSTVSSRSLTESRSEENDLVEEVANAIANSSNGQSVVDFAKQFLGYSYVSGGKTPETGFDCSGFTKYVFGNFGYTLASTAAGQTSVGDVVERQNLQVGDLILFQNEEKTAIGHTGIYIGDGNFIHAANSRRGVVTDNLNTNSYYNERFVTARRIVK